MNVRTDFNEQRVIRVESDVAMATEPLVSVAMITYNHEDFIGHALDSILMQEVDFDYEVVIGEDKSTDRTQEIVEEYQRRHPDKIRLRLACENIYSQGINPAWGVFAACRGKYIALLEGDDYWTDPKKLQKQVDFLEAHPECAGSYHKSKVERSGSSVSYEMPIRQSARNQEDVKFMALALRWGDEIHTSSFVMRRSAYEDIPMQALNQCTFGDNPLFLWIARSGCLHFFPDMMSVYREGVGSWSTRSMTWRLSAHMDTVALLACWFQDRKDISHSSFVNHLQKKLACFAYRQIYHSLQKGNGRYARSYLWWVVLHKPLLICRFLRDRYLLGNIVGLFRSRS